MKLGLQALPPFPSREIENEAIERAREGDRGAETEVIQRNLGLVRMELGKWRCIARDLEELEQEGALGIVEAIERFEPERGLKFSTYAAYWIRKMLRDEAKRQWMAGMGGGSHLVRGRYGRMRAMAETCAAAGGDVVRELAAMAGVHVESARGFLALHQPQLSLDATDTNGHTLADRLPASAPSPEDVLLEGETQRAGRGQLESTCLSVREREVLRRRYFAKKTCRLADLGREWGVSRERARQIEARALSKLRKLQAPAAA